ncbi:uncharacterized protein LOC135330731 isoform X1 [Dromaius novaehollandiae]|uniref:uncharacterized protein LOC135330731 isoform X1 n=1 Tax=Dromaius novaehollandiae TaxID=8790 RepID=UPI00311FEA43
MPFLRPRGCMFPCTGSMIESRLVCCQTSSDFDMWVQHLQHQIETANANCPVSHNNIISFLDSEERLLILFPEDLLFLSVVKERTAITYELSNRGDRENGQRNKELRGAGSSEQLWETKKSLNIKDKKEKSEENIKALFFFSFLKGKLPLTGIQAKEKSAMLRRLRFEVTGSLTEPILITCSTAEDYEKMPLPPTDGIGQRTLLQQYLFSSLGLSQPHIDSSKLYVPPKLSSPFPQKTWVGSSLQAHLSPDRTQHRVPQNIGE